MPDANGLLKAVKRAALDAVDAAKPADIYFGEVINISPLQIRVEQKMILGSPQLILSRNVSDYTTSFTIQWQTETDSAHAHDITGKKEITIHNALHAGERVILARQSGGQKYIVIDRIGGGAA